jgi:hypothetical protein
MVGALWFLRNAWEMRNFGVRPAVFVALGLVLVSGNARADHIVLASGAQLEGKATRRGDKVVVELASGEISLPADAVERVEAAESALDRFNARYAKLRAGDVTGRLELADFCRDEAMTQREQQLLHEVLQLDTNNAKARARLGYVKTDAGWITEDEAMLAKGLVKRDGRWLSSQQLQELEQQRERVESAAKQREIAQAELEKTQLEVERERVALEAEKRRIAEAEAARLHAAETSRVVHYSPVIRSGPCLPREPDSAYSRAFHVKHTRPFPIPGVRDPRDSTWALPGTRNPNDDL